MWYPFDEVVNGQIKGSTPGEIIGDVQLVEGKSYKAIYTDGAHVEYVNLGNLREHCVGDLRLCSHGLTISLWLQPHVIKPGEYHYFTNGGHTRGSIGVFLGQKHERLIAFFRNDTGRWTVTNVPFEAMNWYFITMVWGPNSGARLYLNGCLAGEHITLVPDPSNSNGPYNDFILGTSNSPNHRASLRIEMTMDELKIWNAQMTENQVWELYLSHIWDFHDDVIKWKHFPRYWPFEEWPVTRSFDIFFDLRLNKRLSKQSWGWWFETPSCSLWRHCNEQNLLLPWQKRIASEITPKEMSKIDWYETTKKHLLLRLLAIYKKSRSNPSALVMGLLQSCTKLSKYCLSVGKKAHWCRACLLFVTNDIITRDMI